MTTQPANNSTTASTSAIHRLGEIELLAMADRALEAEPHHAAIDRYWLVALALHESGGDPNAIGDGGQAVGLMQFHMDAWIDALGKGWSITRGDPYWSMVAAIRYAEIGIRRYLKEHTAQGITLRPDVLRRVAALHHNSGAVANRTTVYTDAVFAIRERLIREHKP